MKIIPMYTNDVLIEVLFSSAAVSLVNYNVDNT